MKRKITILTLCAMLLALCGSVDAQQVKDRRIAVIGALEEPRFSEVVAGLKNGLGELGYAKPSLVVQEVKIARSEEKGAKSIVEDLLRQQAQVLFLIGSRLLSRSEMYRLRCRLFSSRRAIRLPLAWSKASPVRAATQPR